MRIIITFLTLFAIAVNLSGQGRVFHNNECEKVNTTLKSIDANNPLYPYLVNEDRKGVLKIHPFTMEEIGGWEAFKQAFTNDNRNTYELVGITKGGLLKGHYYRYQQYFQGIPVVNGGFTVFVETDDPQFIARPPCVGCPPVDPCGLVSMIAPHVYEDIKITIPHTPNIQEAFIASYLPRSPASIESNRLQIINNIKGNCEYLLAWEVLYNDQVDGAMVGWIDAQTGEMLFQKDRHDHKGGPTTDWGIRNMNDQGVGTNTVLRNDRLAVYDMANVAAVDVNGLRNQFNANQIPTSPTVRDWDVTDAPTDVFQAFWMADQVLDAYQSELSIDFADVHIGVHPTARGAISFGGTLNAVVTRHIRSEYAFGQIDGFSLVEYDVIAHELGHSVIREFFTSVLIEGASLHEGIADMFGTYIESKLDALDWQMGDDVPDVTGRDLENTTRNCFTDIANLTRPHDRSEALGHWFFLCVNGDAANNIPAMNIDQVMMLVFEALPNVGSNPDYPDLMNATIDLAEIVFGTCSDQFLTILRAWEQICVPTNHRMATATVPCAFLTASNSFPCEENNYFFVCLSPNSGLNTNQGKWSITGRNSVNFQSQLGMQGNIQQGGSCITITNIPTMPFYPQVLTFQYWHEGIGQTLSQRIILVDCDRDDPTCREYYEIQALSHSNTNVSPLLPSEIIAEDITGEVEALKIIVYDLMGNRLNISKEHLQSNQGTTPRIVILTYWAENGGFVKSEKVFMY